MSSSTLLQLTRDSITEVLQAKRRIDKDSLLQSYPILAKQMGCEVKIFLHKQLRSSFTIEKNQNSLLDNIIICAKKAAFEDPKNPPLTISEYLHSSIELTLFTPDGAISEIDKPIINEPYDGQHASSESKS